MFGLCLSAILAAAPPAEFSGPELAKAVRRVIRREDYDEELERLEKLIIAAKERAFPVYQAILSDPKSTDRELGGTLYLLWSTEADCSRFVPHALRLLEREKQRGSVARFLGRHGSSREGAVLVALMSDPDRTVVRAAAESLSAIGGERELTAMDIWLRGVAHRNDGELRMHVKKARDALQKRLEAKKAVDKS